MSYVIDLHLVYNSLQSSSIIPPNITFKYILYRLSQIIETHLQTTNVTLLLKNGSSLASFSFIFVFSNTLQVLQQILV